MNAAVNIEGQFGRMTGVQFYVDSLLDALADDPHGHAITAFVPDVWSPTLWDAAALPGQFAWHSTGRIAVDMAGNDGYLAMHPCIASRPRLKRLALGVDQGLVHPLRTRFPAPDERRARRAAARYDLLHTPGAIRPESVTYRAKANVVTLYDLTTVTHPETHTPDNVRMSALLFDYARHVCARVLTISEAAKADIAEHLSIPLGRIDVTPLAPRAGTRRITESEALRAALAPLGLMDTPFTLYAGTLEARKNLPGLLRAWAQAASEPSLNSHKLVLAGGARQGHDDELRTLAQTLGIAERVIFAGYVSGDAMNALMSACRVFAYVSFAEGFGLPPLEAMVCGAPVVSSNTSSLPEVVGEAALSVSPSDEGAIAAALHTLLTDDAENMRRRTLSLRRAALFTWTRTAALTVACYEAAVA